jgi:hypothetical protein
VLSIGRERLRVVSVEMSITRCGTTTVHRMEVMTAMARGRRRGRKRSPRERTRARILPMPLGEGSAVGDFLRCHVLVRVFGGNPDAWLDELRKRSTDDVCGADVRFVRWVRARLRYDPMLMAAIRRMVDSTPLWNSASG